MTRATWFTSALTRRLMPLARRFSRMAELGRRAGVPRSRRGAPMRQDVLFGVGCADRAASRASIDASFASARIARSSTLTRRSSVRAAIRWIFALKIAEADDCSVASEWDVVWFIVARQKEAKVREKSAPRKRGAEQFFKMIRAATRKHHTAGKCPIELPWRLSSSKYARCNASRSSLVRTPMRLNSKSVDST